MNKDLEALKYFKSTYNSFLKTTNDMFCQITISREQANEFVEEVEAVEKKVKALEILKKKSPDMVEIKYFKDYEHYKEKMSKKYDTVVVKIDWNDKPLLDYLMLLTEEEFNLLKEVLDNGTD